MSALDHFPPTLAAARARIAALRPADYARSRNAVDGAVSQLSPYLTHGLVGLSEVLHGVAAQHRMHAQHKFVFELGWREYFRHVWQHRGDGILQSLHDGWLPDAAYAPEVPADVRQARTGVPAIDTAVRILYATGYMHNHARLWLASYLVHLRKVHWRAGADWLVAHLLDGDLASNHLNWQWVAGTGSSKPYLFNADNVARYAPAAWHSAGSVIDQSYETLDAMARSSRPVRAAPQGEGVEEPERSSVPRETAVADAELRAVSVAGRDVWLVHPWALSEPPPDLPHGCLIVGLWPAGHHDAWPWGAARWQFAGARMAELTALCWHASRTALAKVLAGARSVQTLADPHVSALLPPEVVQRAPLRLFADVDRSCASFSTWWTRATRGVKTLADLPGLAALAALDHAGPPLRHADTPTPDSPSTPAT